LGTESDPIGRAAEAKAGSGESVDGVAAGDRVGPGRAGSGTAEGDGARWIDRLNWLLHHEIRAAVADDILTSAEAEQLRARLVLVIDQAITPARP